MGEEGSGGLVERIWTPQIADVVKTLFIGWLLSLAVAATLKWILRRSKLNAKLAHRLRKGPDGEPLDLEDRIADGVYWTLLAAAAVVAFSRLWP